MEGKAETPVEEKSYSLLYFVSATILLLVNIWAIGDEMVTRRPWKSYQKQFYKIQTENVKAEYEEAAQNIQFTYENIKTQLAAAKEDINSPKNQDNYKRALRQLNKSQTELDEVNQEYQFVNSEFGAINYLYEKALKEGNQAEAEKKKAQMNKLEEKMSGSLDKIEKATENRGYENLQKVGPSLNRLSHKVKVNWLHKWLKNPKEYLPKAKMPNFLLEDSEVESIAAYLMNIPSKEDFNLRTRYHGSGSPENGKQLVFEVGCLGCHVVFDKGDHFAPDLTQIGRKVNEDWLLDWLKKPTHYEPEAKMPNFRLSDKEAVDVVAYLMTLKGREGKGARGQEDKRTRGQGGISLDSTEKIKEGRELVRTYGCFGCHDIKDMEGESKVGVDLSDFGSKAEEDIPERYARRPSDSEASVEQGRRIIDKFNCTGCHEIEGKGGEIGPFLNHEGSKVKEEWLLGFLKEPRMVRNKIKGRMPTFRLFDEEAFVLTKYMMTLTDEEMFPKESIDEGKVTLETLEYGKRLYQEYACFSCHKIFGEGGEKGDIGPDLNHVGSRIKPDWEYIWLKNPPAVIPDTEMENFEMWDDEAEAITKYLQTLK